MKRLFDLPRRIEQAPDDKKIFEADARRKIVDVLLWYPWTIGTLSIATVYAPADHVDGFPR